MVSDVINRQPLPVLTVLITHCVCMSCQVVAYKTGGGRKNIKKREKGKINGRI